MLGAFALYDVKEPFAQEIKSYFQRWIDALKFYLQNQGLSARESEQLANFAMIAIQGGLVMAQATNNTDIFAQGILNAQNMMLERINYL